MTPCDLLWSPEQLYPGAVPRTSVLWYNRCLAEEPSDPNCDWAMNWGSMVTPDNGGGGETPFFMATVMPPPSPAHNMHIIIILLQTGK